MNQPRRRILASYMSRHPGWTVTFLEADCKTSAGRRLNFSDSEKLIELATRGGVTLDLETRQSLEHGIRMGRGSIWLFLTPEQYAKLR